MWTKILNLVKEALNSRKKIKELRAEIKDLKDEVKAANTAFEQQKSAYSRLVDRVQPYIDALGMYPQEVKEAISSFIKMGRESRELQRQQKIQQQQEHTAPKRKRSNDLDR
jgi:septation ring formation regulator EzrA